MVAVLCSLCERHASIYCDNCAKTFCFGCNENFHRDKVALKVLSNATIEDTAVGVEELEIASNSCELNRIPSHISLELPRVVEMAHQQQPELQPSISARHPFNQVAPMLGGDGDEKKRCAFLNDPERHVAFKYPDNSIRTAKYTLLSFVPLTLFAQFKRLANIYFLLVSCLQLFTDLSPTSKYTTAGPLALVVGFSMLREAYEDMKRHRADKEVNNRQCPVLRRDTNNVVSWILVASKEIKVGDVMLLKDREEVLGDVVLLSCNAPDGTCYIDTQNLDGETNLKLRKCMDNTSTLQQKEELGNICGYCEYEEAGKNLYVFTGTMEVRINGTSSRYPVNVQNTIWRGATLRNTKFAHGLVIYTGRQTRMMMNSLAPATKRSNVEVVVNKTIFMVFGLELLFCIICALLMSSWISHNRAAWYVPFVALQTAPDAALGALTFFILYNNFVPISLYVTMEFVKMIQAILIDSDLEMYDSVSDTPAMSRTSNLNEELGQVEYIFSDKTGTLTCNEMEFRKCSIRGEIYGYGTTEIGLAAAAAGRMSMVQNELDTQRVSPQNAQVHYDPKISFNDPRLLERLRDKSGDDGLTIEEFLTMMALCHTVVPEGNPTLNQLEYQGESPDEVALVLAAKCFGYFFIGKTSQTLTIEINGIPVHYRILAVNKFNSTRKRMSIACRRIDRLEDVGCGPVSLYVKGADNVILSHLSASARNQQDIIKKHLQQFGEEGLRTLLLAKRIIDADTWEQLQEQYTKASLTLTNREDALDSAAEAMEVDLEIVGVTAIEDKLQKGVPATIATLAAAGINIWILTGDKEETAINIGFACCLLTSKMEISIVNSTVNKEIERKFNRLLRENEQYIGKKTEHLALVISGEALSCIHDSELLRQQLLVFAGMCKAVIACRVSPRQKAEMVNLVRFGVDPLPLTLAIGDGANDVPMITAAHVGIGISGKEGMQAVRASDYAIAQFRYLNRLLLFHGRNNYKRISIVILYSFYKNCALVCTLFFFCIFNGFSGTTLLHSYISATYNVIYTSLPIIAFGVFNKDLKAESVVSEPKLYLDGQMNNNFNRITMLQWMINGVVHGVLLFHLPAFALQYATETNKGHTQENLQLMGQTVGFALVACVNIRLALEVTNWTALSLTITAISVICYILVVFILSGSVTISSDLLGLGVHMFGEGNTWAAFFLGTVTCSMIDLFAKAWSNTFLPTLATIVREKQLLESKRKVSV